MAILIALLKTTIYMVFLKHKNSIKNKLLLNVLAHILEIVKEDL